MKSLSARVKTILSAQLTMAVLALLCLVTLFELSQIAYKRYETEREIENYEKDIVRLQQEQGELKDLLEFLNTDYFAEREVRTKLGLQMPGEQVVIISRPDTQVLEEEEGGADEKGQESALSTAVTSGVPTEVAQKKNNPTKWGDYFFGETE